MNEHVVSRTTLSAPDVEPRSDREHPAGIPDPTGPWLDFGEGDPVRQFATMTFLRGALVAMAVTVVFGLLGALYSIPYLAPSFQSVGLDLRQLRRGADMKPFAVVYDAEQPLGLGTGQCARRLVHHDHPGIE